MFRAVAKKDVVSRRAKVSIYRPKAQEGVEV
jgi:hypothetical protein